MGDMPGPLPWKFGETLKAPGFTIVNDGISGTGHQGRMLLTGDSPLTSHSLGRLAAGAMLTELV